MVLTLHKTKKIELHKRHFMQFHCNRKYKNRNKNVKITKYIINAAQKNTSQNINRFSVKIVDYVKRYNGQFTAC